MGKWVIISVLLFVFSGLGSGSNSLSASPLTEKRQPATGVQESSLTLRGETVITGVQASLQSALPSYPLRRLISGGLVLPEAGCHSISSHPLTIPRQLTAGTRYVLISSDLSCSTRESLPRDHFDYLFPFFHFW